jgi:site-specific DNA-methyltransferase (adenine-specific)
MTDDLRCELRVGRWQDALADVGEVDALISDPPYSERTHSGHDVIVGKANAAKRQQRRPLGYEPWTPGDVEDFVRAWSPRVRGWFVVMTDHVLATAWESSLARQGLCVFAPLQYMQPGSRVRLSGDGPALWSVTIVVARPRSAPYAHWGSLPGGYVLPRGLGREAIIGGKPLWIMRELIGDYTRRGDLIVDPCAGGATTLIAARSEGRHSVGAELDPATYELARKRIVRPYPLGLFDALGGVDGPSDVHGPCDSQTDDAER